MAGSSTRSPKTRAAIRAGSSWTNEARRLKRSLSSTEPAIPSIGRGRLTDHCSGSEGWQLKEATQETSPCRRSSELAHVVFRTAYPDTSTTVGKGLPQVRGRSLSRESYSLRVNPTEETPE